MECLGVDITGPHPVSSRGYHYIMTVIDHYSRWAEAYPIRNQEAATVARMLMDQWIPRFGCPKQLLTDQGPCFEAALFRDLCRLMQIDKIRTSPYKPSTNGTVERLHRTLNSMLGKVVAQNQKDWDIHLPWIMGAYRASQHESTGFTPNKLFLGRETCLPIDLVLGDCNQNNAQLSVNDYIQKRTEEMRDVFQLARECMQKQAVRRAFRYDLRVKKPSFTKGQWVYYYYPRKYTRIKDKWAKWFCGPYRIMEQVSPVLFRIQKSARSQALLVYVDKLKPYLGEPPSGWTEPDLQPQEPIEFPGTEDTNDAPVELSRPRRTITRPARYCS